MSDLFTRLGDIEQRLRALERRSWSGISGTDQTIVGSHDRLDALLGAGGTPTNARLATVVKTGIADNSATGIFTVTTTNEVNEDGGGFTCKVESLIGHAIASDATDLAIEWNYSVFQRINKGAGTDYGALGEIYEGASTASTSATRDIGATTPSITLTSDYVTTFNLTIDLTGTGVTTGQAVCLITLIWYGYLTAPVIASA